MWPDRFAAQRLSMLCVAAIAISGCRREPPAATRIWEELSGDNAFAHVQKLVALGPRPAGSDALEQSRRYITGSLERLGWRVERQAFTASTPRGEMQFVNLIARRSGASAGTAPRWLVCSHYDTKTVDGAVFVGANDGGSSTGLLLEIARVLGSDQRLAAQVELVFFDGEEAFEAFTETDGLYGSRHFAQQIAGQNRVKQYRGGVVFDMIGDKSLTVTLSPDSPVELARGIFASADALGVRNHFTYLDRQITDDHTPLNAIGIATIDLIDFDFPQWHTPDDNIDNVSAESLRIVGRVALHFLAQSSRR